MRIRQPGKTRVQVQCVCGAKRMVYVWSWGGNGTVQCRKCNQHMFYRNRHLWETRNVGKSQMFIAKESGNNILTAP